MIHASPRPRPLPPQTLTDPEQRATYDAIVGFSVESVSFHSQAVKAPTVAMKSKNPSPSAFKHPVSCPTTCFAYSNPSQTIAANLVYACPQVNPFYDSAFEKDQVFVDEVSCIGEHPACIT